MYLVCDEICEEGEYYYFEDTREKKCSDFCPEHKPFIAEKENENDPYIECIGNCSDNGQLLINNTFICVKECPEGYYEVNSTCVDKCEDG